MCDLIVFRIDFLIIGINQFLIYTQLHPFANRNGSHCLSLSSSLDLLMMDKLLLDFSQQILTSQNFSRAFAAE